MPGFTIVLANDLAESAFIPFLTDSSMTCGLYLCELTSACIVWLMLYIPQAVVIIMMEWIKSEKKRLRSTPWVVAEAVL